MASSLASVDSAGASAGFYNEGRRSVSRSRDNVAQQDCGTSGRREEDALLRLVGEGRTVY